MASGVVRTPSEASPFPEAFARIRAEFRVPDAYPGDAEEEATAVAARGPLLPPDAPNEEPRDARDMPFVTIDPPGTKDLDQALFLEAHTRGFRVHYAIADVASFVAPGGALDRESFARGVTLYLPDGAARMLPNALSEGVASLLPGEDRAALLWTIDLDAHGVTTSARLERAIVRSRAALDYPSVQHSFDAQRVDDSLATLRTIGTLRRELEAARGGVSLDVPTQEVVRTSTGTYELRYDAPLPVEGWNAQISLLTGMEAARIMVAAHTGILRTLPPPQQWQLDRLRHVGRLLDVPWPRGAAWGDVVRTLDRSNPDHAAFLIQAAHVLRGAGYDKLDQANTADSSVVPVHAGVAAPYAHVTAPLRRLADRYANEIVLASCAGRQPPEWAIASLDDIVKRMEEATRRDASVERAVIDAAECAVLAARVGEEFRAVVVDKNAHGPIVQLRDPAVVAALGADDRNDGRDAHLDLGDTVVVRVVAVDPVVRHVHLAPSGDAIAGA